MATTFVSGDESYRVVFEGEAAPGAVGWRGSDFVGIPGCD